MADAISIGLVGFADVPLTDPIDWLANPHGSALWQHHLLSLRWLRPWLRDRQCADPALKVLRDFFAYHSDPNKPKSPYFEGREADHTMAERLLLLAEVHECENLPEQLKGALVDLVRSHFERLVTDKIYRPRTNHGLMIDKAILVASTGIPAADPDGRYAEIAVERSADQVDWSFTAAGVTREHSISYQEYNLNICLELLDALRASGRGHALIARLESLLRQAQEVLAYAVDSNGHFLPLGDTFRESNSRVVAALEEKGVLDARFAYALSRGAKGTPPTSKLLVVADGGFAFVRDAADPERVVHLGMTAAWHSQVHKQSDDLSFVLSHGTQEVIVDAGYSDRRAEAEEAKRSRSEMAHNVVICRQHPWQTHQDANLRAQTRLTAYHAGRELLAVAGQHRRIGEVLVRRTLALLPGGLLLVLDQVDAGLTGEFCQLFHLAPGLVPSARADGYTVVNPRGEVCAHFSPIVAAASEVVTTTLPGGPVCERWRDRSQTEPTTCLVYSAVGDGRSPVRFSQLIELGPSLAPDQPKARVEELEWSSHELSFALRRGDRSERIRVELEPLSSEPVRWP